jgi:hypothetical protein
MIASTQIGITIGYNRGKNADYEDNTIDAVHIYNNTIIEPHTADSNREVYRTNVLQISPEHMGSGHIIKNNIFWQSSGTIAIGSFSNSKIDMGYNLWSMEPPSAFKKTSDATFNDGYPTLMIADYFNKTNGWKNLTAGSLSADDFQLRSTAKYAIGMGTSKPVDSPEASFLNPDVDKWNIGATIPGTTSTTPPENDGDIQIATPTMVMIPK